MVRVAVIKKVLSFIKVKENIYVHICDISKETYWSN